MAAEKAKETRRISGVSAVKNKMDEALPVDAPLTELILYSRLEYIPIA